MNAPATGQPFVWQGRIDAEETGVTTRWHQHVRPWHAQARGGVALLGFACDEGVRRNGGRPGAGVFDQVLLLAVFLADLVQHLANGLN